MPPDTVAPELLQQRLGGLMKLVEITCRLAVQHDLDEILETVTEGVCESLNCERASLFLYDERRGELYTRVATELELEEIRTSIGKGITGWVARERKLANISDPDADPRWNGSFDRESGFRTRNLLAAPVLSPRDGRTVGVLESLNKRNGAFNEYDERILEAFAAHAATALERARLIEEARRSHELQVSIELGRSIQTSFLPRSIPRVPGYEIATWWQPAEAVSGDYYDVIGLPDGRLGIVVADVSGHGVGPSLIMASVRAMLHVVAQSGSDPHDIISLLSETIYPDLQSGRFITFLMVALNPRTHQITFANAGHGPALHFRRGDRAFRELEATCLPIGVKADLQVPSSRVFELDPGDLLVLATDGAFELRNDEDEMFGVDRLKQLIVDNRRLPASELMNVIRKTITSFHPGDHPPDDVTVLLLERKLQEN